jgi:hypothetical protein
MAFLDLWMGCGCESWRASRGGKGEGGNTPNSSHSARSNSVDAYWFSAPLTYYLRLSVSWGAETGGNRVQGASTAEGGVGGGEQGEGAGGGHYERTQSNGHIIEFLGIQILLTTRLAIRHLTPAAYQRPNLLPLAGASRLRGDKMGCILEELDR